MMRPPEHSSTPNPHPPTAERIQTTCLVILSAFAIGVTLYFLRPVLVPFTLAVFFAIILSPVLDFLVDRIRMPRPVALFLTLTLGLVIASTIAGLVVDSMTRLADNAPEYQESIENFVRENSQRLPLERFGFDPEKDFDPLTLVPEGFMENALVRSTGAITGILSQSILVLLFVLFLLLGSSTRTEPRSGVLGDIEYSVKRYLVTKVIVSAITGVLVYFILNSLGVRFALAFGTFAFILNFVPNIGSIISTLLPMPVVLLTPDVSTTTMLLALALPGAVQFAIGNVIEPKIMGDSLDLHPVAVLMALIFWGTLWGPVGMLVAAPLTAITKLSLEKLDVTAPAARLLAGRF